MAYLMDKENSWAQILTTQENLEWGVGMDREKPLILMELRTQVPLKKATSMDKVNIRL